MNRLPLAPEALAALQAREAQFFAGRGLRPQGAGQPSRRRRKARYRANHPAKWRAQRILHRAIRTGFLVRPIDCARCGRAGPVTGHHVTYAHPLKVVWLCQDCHNRQHRAAA